MKHLYFIRHGLSVTNQLGVYSGHSETPLAELGKEQARLAGDIIKNYEIDVIVSSPLERAKNTAEIIAEVIGYPTTDILINKLFIERRLGILEGTPFTGGNLDYDSIEGVEKSKDILARAQRALDWLESLNKDTVLVVSHGAMGRALRHTVLGPANFSDPYRFKNGEVVQLI